MCGGQSGQPMGEKTGGQKQRGELRQTMGRRLPPVRNRASQGGGESNPGMDAASVTSEKGQLALEGRVGPLPDGSPLPVPSCGLPNQEPLQDEWGMGDACAVSPWRWVPPTPEARGPWRMERSWALWRQLPQTVLHFPVPTAPCPSLLARRPCSRPADSSHQTL